MQSALEKVNPHYRVIEGKPETVPRTRSNIDFRVHSNQGTFELDQAPVEGKATLVLFMEEEGWAALTFQGKIEPVAQEFGLAVRVIYLGDDPAREQFRRDFGKEILPYLRVYDEMGVFRGGGNSLDQLRRILRR